jgi:hypothetical protein
LLGNTKSSSRVATIGTDPDENDGQQFLGCSVSILISLANVTVALRADLAVKYLDAVHHDTNSGTGASVPMMLAQMCATDSAAAKSLIHFLARPAVAPVIRSMGYEPG